MATTPGAVTAPFPTVENIAVEWAISGDTDLDGVVSVRYRPAGSGPWIDGMPLRRVPAGANEGFNWGNRHSGSAFDLSPGTTYEIELTLDDPDGGNDQQIVVASTRAVPEPMAGATVTPVTPVTLSGALSSASPGNILELGPGDYSGFRVDVSGSAGMPIVIRGTPGAVINGEVRLFSRKHVMLERLTVNGRIRFNGSDNISVVSCRVNASPTQFNGDGIVALLRAENAYIADNTVIGTTVWEENSLGASGNNRGEGIAVTGPGHVIMNNLVSGFRDNISLLEEGEAVDQFSIDVLNNELSEAADDAVEADFCFHNCRIMRNRVTNAFISFSSQPSLGGPNYFIRNVAYNVAFQSFKLQRGSEGDVLLHNTVVKNGNALGIATSDPVSRLFTRNNLLIGGPGGTFNGFNSGTGDVIRIQTLVTANADLNFDALGSTTGNFEGRFGNTNFDSLAELRSQTTETDAVEIDLGVFADSIAYPANPLTTFAAPDLRLQSGGDAIDVGEAIGNVNSGFAGAAPDAGAYELGGLLPEYGPRLGLIFADGFEVVLVP